MRLTAPGLVLLDTGDYEPVLALVSLELVWRMQGMDIVAYTRAVNRERRATLGGGSTMPGVKSMLPALWAEFDPTNGIVGNRDLIRVAARKPRQVIPLSGGYDGTAADFESLSVQMNVTAEAEYVRHYLANAATWFICYTMPQD